MHLLAIRFLSGVLNDLDLTVHGDEKVFYPNGLVSGPDKLNNAERVIIDHPTNGATYSIRVFGSNLLDEQVNPRNRSTVRKTKYDGSFRSHGNESFHFFFLGLLSCCDWLSEGRGSWWWC
jgi:hypothetical protein